jgi:hypothetical protein
MEVRVMEAVRVAEAAGPGVPPPGQAIAEPFELMRAFLCGGEPRPLRGGASTGAELRLRNARQDVALAGASSEALRDEMKKAMGGCNAPAPVDPEFYLRFRDLLLAAPPGAEKVRGDGPPR